MTDFSTSSPSTLAALSTDSDPILGPGLALIEGTSSCWSLVRETADY